MRWKGLLCLAVLVILLSSGASANTEIVRYVLGSGGVQSGGQLHEIMSTLGQPVVSVATGGQHSIHSGFWLQRAAPSLILQEEGTEVPLAFQLETPAPNPFTGSITLRLDVPRPGGHIVLKIHDVRGSVVRTLLDGPQDPGRWLMRWNGRSDHGARVAAGVYFLRLNGPGYERSCKVTLSR